MPSAISDESLADHDIGSLHSDKKVDSSTIDIEDQFRQLELNEARKAVDYRKRLFNWGMVAASGCILVSVGWMILSIWVKGSDVLGSTFIGSLAVEVIGIIAIIAKYLFPDHGLPRSRPEVKSATDSKI